MKDRFFCFGFWIDWAKAVHTSYIMYAVHHALQCLQALSPFQPQSSHCGSRARLVLLHSNLQCLQGALAARDTALPKSSSTRRADQPRHASGTGPIYTRQAASQAQAMDSKSTTCRQLDYEPVTYSL